MFGGIKRLYYDLLKPGKNVNADCYQNQIVKLKKYLVAKRLELANRHGKVIILLDNAPAHTSKGVKRCLGKYLRTRRIL